MNAWSLIIVALGFCLVPSNILGARWQTENIGKVKFAAMTLLIYNVMFLKISWFLVYLFPIKV